MGCVAATALKRRHRACKQAMEDGSQRFKGFTYTYQLMQDYIYLSQMQHTRTLKLTVAACGEMCDTLQHAATKVRVAAAGLAISQSEALADAACAFEAHAKLLCAYAAACVRGLDMDDAFVQQLLHKDMHSPLAASAPQTADISAFPSLLLRKRYQCTVMRDFWISTEVQPSGSSGPFVHLRFCVTDLNGIPVPCNDVPMDAICVDGFNKCPTGIASASMCNAETETQLYMCRKKPAARVAQRRPDEIDLFVTPHPSWHSWYLWDPSLQYGQFQYQPHCMPYVFATERIQWF